MNVTIKLDDSQCKAARHRAVDEGLSLSGWIGKVLEKELAYAPHKDQRTLIDLLGDRRASDADLEIPIFSETAVAAKL